MKFLAWKFDEKRIENATRVFEIRIKDNDMKRELGIGRCGLVCALCFKNSECMGCNSVSCIGSQWCENTKCSKKREIAHCHECEEFPCGKGMLVKTRLQAFSEFARRYGKEELLDCLERNESMGIMYHREGFISDYDGFSDIEELIEFIKSGKKPNV